MTRYVTLPHNKKLNLLRDPSLGCEWPDLDQEHWCLHCGQKFNGHAVRVWQNAKGRLWLECGTPGCDGSPIDWAPYPWWEPRHPATREYLKRQRQPRRGKPTPGRGEDDVPF